MSFEFVTPADPAPFASQAVLRAYDREAVAEALSTQYGASVRRFGEADTPLVAEANRAAVGPVQFHYCRYDTPIEIGFSNMAGLRQMTPLSGRGAFSWAGRAVEVDPTTTCILPPGASFDVAYGEGYQHLVTQFDPDALRRRVEAIVGAGFGADLDVPVLKPLAGAARVRSRQIALALGRILALDSVRVDPSLVEMAQALSTAFLVENLPGFADLLDQTARPAQRSSARRLEDYIQENWSRPITVEDIAAACGVSVRSVFARFKQDRGVAPITYLREVRLDHARRILLDPQGEASIIAVAMACGFASFGHFARRYRERFGELPSATLARREPS